MITRKTIIKIIILSLFFVTAHFNDYAQNAIQFKSTVLEPYNIPDSKGIKYTIDKNITDSLSPYQENDSTPGYQSMTLGTRKNSKNNFLSDLFVISYFVSGDTSIIILFPKESAAGGFRINIIGDSAKSFHFIMAFDQEDTSGSIKLNQSDRAYKNELLVPPTICKLILSKKTEFKAGEIFEGFIEFESQVYYSKNESEGKKLSDVELQWYISGYFRTFDAKKLKTK